MNRENIIWLIVIVTILMFISVVHKLIVYKRIYIGRKEKRKKKHHCPHKPPTAVGFIIEEIETLDSNNNLIIFKGNIMSVSLVGKQQVVGTLAPIDANGNVIDLNQWPIDQVIQTGSIMASSSDLALFGVSIDPSNQLKLIVTSVGDLAGDGTVTFVGRDINGNAISGSDTVSVTIPEPTTTTSTSTSTTTTEPPVTAPLAAGFQINWEAPTDVVS